MWIKSITNSTHYYSYTILKLKSLCLFSGINPFNTQPLCLLFSFFSFALLPFWFWKKVRMKWISLQISKSILPNLLLLNFYDLVNLYFFCTNLVKLSTLCSTSLCLQLPTNFSVTRTLILSNLSLLKLF